MNNSSENEIRIERLKTVEGHEDYITDLAFDESGTFLVSCSSDFLIHEWQILEETPQLHQISTMEPDMTGEILDLPNIELKNNNIISSISSRGEDGLTLNIYDQDTSEYKNSIKNVECFAVSPDGNDIVTGNSLTKMINTYDVDEGMGMELFVPEIISNSNDRYVAMSIIPDEGVNDDIVIVTTEVVFIANMSTQECREIHRIGRIILCFETFSLQCSSSGELILLGFVSPKPTIMLFDSKTGDEIRVITIPNNGEGDTFNAIFNHDSTQIVCTYGAYIYMFDVETGSQTIQYQSEQDTITSIAIDPRGGHIVVGDDEGKLHLYSVHYPSTSSGPITSRKPKQVKKKPAIMFDSVKWKKKKPFDLIEYKSKTPSLNEHGVYDMFFQLGKYSVTLSTSQLNKLINDPTYVKFECKDHVGRNALFFREKDYVHEKPYFSIRSMGILLDGLVLVSDMRDAIQRYNSYYDQLGGTTRKKRCPKGSRRDKTSGKCKSKTTGEFVDSLTEASTTTTNTRKKRKGKKKQDTPDRIKFSPIEYKRNFQHSLVFVFEETPKIVERVVSKSVANGGSVISADHCQNVHNFRVYNVKEISNKIKNKGKNVRSLTASKKKNPQYLGKKSKKRQKGKKPLLSI
jgi:WD40 repeat protein